MSSPWNVASNIVKLNDETNWKVRVGPDQGTTPLPKFEVVGDAQLSLRDRGGNVFDVRAYGARGDGSTDDRGAIQAAIDAMPASGATLYLPAGNYKVTKDGSNPWALSIVDKAVLVRGAGPDATIITINSTTAHGIRTQFTAIPTDRELYMEIRDLKIVSGGVANPTSGAAIFQQATNPDQDDLRWQNTFVVRNCWFFNVWDAIHLTNTGSAIIKDCQILNALHAAIFLESEYNEFYPTVGDIGTTFICDNYIWDRVGDPEDFGNHPGHEIHGVLATSGVPGLRIHHNSFQNFDRPVYIDRTTTSNQTRVHIDHNSFDGYSREAKLRLRGQGGISFLDISSNDFTIAAPDGIGVLGDVNTVSGLLATAVIAGNSFYGLDDVEPLTQKGIVLNPTDPATARAIRIDDNIFTNLLTGIEIGQTCDQIYIGDNAFENVTAPLSVATSPASATRTLGAFFPDRLGVGGIDSVTAGVGADPATKEIYAASDQPFRPRVYLKGAAGVSAPGIDFAFDNTNTRRAGIVATAPVLLNDLGVQLEFFTKPDSSTAITQRAILDTAGNLVWTSANYQEMMELGTDPAAPAANKARLFLRDNGLGKTQLCVRFSTGAVQVLATQP